MEKNDRVYIYILSCIHTLTSTIASDIRIHFRSVSYGLIASVACLTTESKISLNHSSSNTVLCILIIWSISFRTNYKLFLPSYLDRARKRRREPRRTPSIPISSPERRAWTVPPHPPTPPTPPVAPPTTTTTRSIRPSRRRRRRRRSPRSSPTPPRSPSRTSK